MKILVVDDDEFIHEVVAMYLAAGGHEVLHALSSAEAHEVLKTAKRIDLLITDIVMPGEDGTKLIRDLHDVMPDLPVLAMTGGVENAMDDYIQLAEFFADFTVAKPLKKVDLLQGMKAAFDNAEKRRARSVPGADQPLDSLQKLLECCS